MSRCLDCELYVARAGYEAAEARVGELEAALRRRGCEARVLDGDGLLRPCTKQFTDEWCETCRVLARRVLEGTQ